MYYKESHTSLSLRLPLELPPHQADPLWQLERHQPLEAGAMVPLNGGGCSYAVLKESTWTQAAFK